jgi:hypothetical protein
MNPCPNCGDPLGHHGLMCPFKKAQPCVICGEMTVWACSDCQISRKETIHVCTKPACRNAHERERQCRPPLLWKARHSCV